MAADRQSSVGCPAVISSETISSEKELGLNADDCGSVWAFAPLVLAARLPHVLSGFRSELTVVVNALLLRHLQTCHGATQINIFAALST